VGNSIREVDGGEAGKLWTKKKRRKKSLIGFYRPSRRLIGGDRSNGKKGTKKDSLGTVREACGGL